MLSRDAFRYRITADASDWSAVGLLVGFIDRRYRVSSARSAWLGAAWMCRDADLGALLMSTFCSTWSNA